MRIIVMADTHSADLPEELVREIRKADLVIHAGDIADGKYFSRLKALKEIRAVYGNVDGTDLRGILPRQDVVECAGIKIGMAHGDGAPLGVIERLGRDFEGRGVAMVIFGHTHEPFNAMVNGMLFFNPGSPTDTIRAPYRSYGVIEAHEGKFKARIVKIK